MWRFFSSTVSSSSLSARQHQPPQEQDWWIETAHHDDSLFKCYSFASSSFTSSSFWGRQPWTFDDRNTTNIIGQGSFGVVRKCQNTITHEWCACKSIAKRRNCGGDGDDDSHEDLKRAVQREVENLQRIHQHPHLIELYGVWEDATHVHIVTELCTGGELYDLIVSWKKQKTKHQTGLLSPPPPPSEQEAQCARILHDILQALQYLHEVHHMAHRDLKASNFLLTSTGQVKIIDFGLSRVVDDDYLEAAKEEETSAASTSAATMMTTMTTNSILLDTSTGSPPGSTTTTTTTTEPPKPTTNSTTRIAKVSPPQEEEDHHDWDDKDDALLSDQSRMACSSDDEKTRTTPNDNVAVTSSTSSDVGFPNPTIPATTSEDGDKGGGGGGGYIPALSSFQAAADDDDDGENDTPTTSQSHSHTHLDADGICQRQPLPRACTTTNGTRSADTSLAYLSAASSSMSQYDDVQEEEEEDEPEASSRTTTTAKDIKTLYGVMTSEVGTPFFVAPEVLLEEEYTYLCDIWSIGVIAYLLLSKGHFPLDTFDERTSIRRLMDPHYTIQFPHATWSQVSSDAQDFCAQLLQKDPSQRPTARQALQHSWIRRHISNIDSCKMAAATTVENE